MHTNDVGVAGDDVTTKVRHYVKHFLHHTLMGVTGTCVANWFSFNYVILNGEHKTNKVWLFNGGLGGGHGVIGLSYDE